MGGYSKATYIARIADGGDEQTVVIRKDSLGLPTGSSVTAEFPVIGEMTAIGVPAPAPLWMEPDATLCGGAFMGVDFASGKPANQIVPTDPKVCREWAESTAHVLARLHSGTALPQADVREPIAADIDGLEQRMLERERAPHPGLLVGLRWLRQNIDRLAGRPACRIHGDVGFHNMLMDGGRITALLDWEFSRIGDPVEDLASIKPFMDQIGGWDIFYATYQGEGGFTVDARAEDYFTVWQETRNMVACLGSLNSLLMPGVFEVPLTVAGTIYIPKYEIAIFDAIAKAEKTDG
jgi:aminoglycoside phosphotransferase (APT) family kinase protein